MDKGILRNFAINARNDLEERIENKINSYFIDEKFTIEQRGDLYYLNNDDHSLTLSSTEYEKRELLIKRIDELTLERVIEEAAYTWFNRLIAVRYMEIHDYLPLTRANLGLGIRVLSSPDNKLEPEILKYTNLINTNLDIKFNKKTFERCVNDNDKFKYILELIIDKIKIVIPQVFGGITDYVDLLLPENLLNGDSFIHNLIFDLPEHYFNNVEIIGWLYQYYNQTKKDEVFAAKKTYKKHEISYATQLFTPDWIVKYMVQNTLGRYWIENSNENSTLIKKWTHLIKDEIKFSGDLKSPEEIKFIDPCCGSGHIMVYAFDVFYQIYSTIGYSKNDIPTIILTKNLYGLDIDDRAAQLSVLSVLLKARDYDKNIFNNLDVNKLNILSLSETRNLDEFSKKSLPISFSNELEELEREYFNAKEVGSLLLGIDYDYENLVDTINNSDFIVKSNLETIIDKVVKQNDILNSKYDIVVTNPPYMGSRNMPPNLKKYINQHYKNYKSDLYSSFIYRSISLSKRNGYISLITPPSFMFLSSFEKLRETLLDKTWIASFLYMGRGIFGVDFGSASFVLKKTDLVDKPSYFFKLHEKTFQLLDLYDIEKLYITSLNNLNFKFNFAEYDINKSINKQFIEGNQIDEKAIKIAYLLEQTNLGNIPGKPLSFWSPKKIIELFGQAKPISEKAIPRTGIKTGDNNRFLRFWWEVNYLSIEFNRESAEISSGNKKWHPYNKGGAFRKWFGNEDYIINYNENGRTIFQHSDNRTSQNYPEEFKFKPSISWSMVSSGAPSFRIKKNNLFDIGGPSLFPKNQDDFYYFLGFLNSNIAKEILFMLNPTINYQGGDIGNLPIIISDKSKINELVHRCIDLSKRDWDSNELSWNFKSHPFILEMKTFHYGNKGGNDYLLEDIYNHLKTTTDMRFNELKNTEIEINRLFNKKYELTEDVSSELMDKDITITKIFNSEKDVYDQIKSNKYIKTSKDIVKSFISYFVGCLFGRYSLDEEGIVYAGGEFETNNYKKFKPLKNNVIPITDSKYFSEDIVYNLFVFLELLFSKETLNDNISFIANVLEKKGLETDEETIRRYFINDFFKDHIHAYNKKPIYWLFDSGKDDGFKGLMYIHRYDDNLIPKIRLDYVHAMQNIYQRELEEVKYKLTTDLVLSEKKKLQDREVDLNKKIVELNNYDELIAHAANQRITLDLDDGVDVNYDKLKELLAKK